MTALRSRAARIVAFLALSAGAFPLAGMGVGMLGLGGGGTPTLVAFSLLVAALILGATVACARLGGERLADLGFRARRRDLLATAGAFTVGAALFAAVALVLGAAAGGSWQRGAGVPPWNAIAGLGISLALMLGEELVFRGYAFQQLRRAVGDRWTIVLSAALFGVYHLIGTDYWAMGAVFRVLMPAAGGLVFGYAVVRTGSLAVAIGLHWGGNWAQAVLLGLGHGPESHAVWVMPLGSDQVRALTAPDLLPHLPYLTALALAVLFVRLAAPRATAA